MTAVAAIAIFAMSSFGEEVTSQNNEHLKKWLEKFPQADLNGDGVLTAAEVWEFQSGKHRASKPRRSANAEG